MAKVLIVYATDYGNTKKMAEAVASGVSSVAGAQVEVKTAEEATAEDVLACDGLIIGSPTHMGSTDWRVKKFIDKICSKLWMEDKLIGKVGGVFATGGGFGNAGGGCELTMLAMLNNLAELGIIIAPLPKNTPGYYAGGLQWGPYARSSGEKMEQTGVTPERLEAAKHHGANIARLAAILKGKEVFLAAQLAAKHS
jgi:NAD(P)H dehydrogenase (quinone)